MFLRTEIYHATEDTAIDPITQTHRVYISMPAVTKFTTVSFKYGFKVFCLESVCVTQIETMASMIATSGVMNGYSFMLHTLAYIRHY